jgi:hypothetical protein
MIVVYAASIDVAAAGEMGFKPKQGSNRPPPVRKQSEVRPATLPDDRRGAVRWTSDAEVEILAPVSVTASAVDVSATGIQLSLGEWISTGTLCDLRITTHTGRQILKRARVVWVRRVGDGCLAGLQVVGSIAPPPASE